MVVMSVLLLVEMVGERLPGLLSAYIGSPPPSMEQKLAEPPAPVPAHR